MLKKITESEKKQFKKICKEKVAVKILEFINKYIGSKVTKEDKSLADFIIESDENFLNCINFINCFDRRSESFKLITEYHRLMFFNYPKYYECWKRISNDDNFMQLCREANCGLRGITDDLILK